MKTDGSLGSAQTLSGPNYQIGPGLGRLVGHNLFHSFSQFDLDQGDVATFTAPVAVKNILVRITGGSASNVDGTIATRLDTNANAPHPASFYFINPSGVIFGPDASLDTGGSFTVTTAHTIRLSDGAQFSTDTSPAPLLRASGAAAFGFLPSPAPITINGSTLVVGQTRAITIVGGGIQITGGALQAPGGSAALASVAGAGTVIASGENSIDTGGVKKMGQIAMSSGGLVDCTGFAGGSIAIRADNLSLTDSSLVAQTNGAGIGRGISVVLASGLSLVRSGVDSRTSGDGRAGDIEISARDFAAEGDRADHLCILAGSTSADAHGRGGNISVHANTLTLLDGASISSNMHGGGRGGDLTVDLSGAAILSGVDAAGTGSAILSSGESSGAAGNIRLSARSLQLLDSGAIASSALGTGNGGDITIKVAEQAVVSSSAGTGNISFIDASTFSTGGGGDAGNINFSAGSLHVLGGAVVSSFSVGSGRGGNIKLRVSGDSVISGEGVQNASAIHTDTVSTFVTGRAGSVELMTRNLQLLGGAEISSTTAGIADAGNVAVKATGKAVVSGAGADGRASAISAGSNASDAGGRAGSVSVRAHGLQVLAGGAITSGTRGGGDGGDVNIKVSGPVVVSGADSHGTVSRIAAASGSTDAGGAAGTVGITAASLQISNGANISSATFGQGNGGNVRVRAGRLLMTDGGRVASATDGSGNGGDIALRVSGPILLSGAGLAGQPTAIAANALSSGHAGRIDITGGRMTLQNGAVITSSSAGDGAAGNVTLGVDSLAVTGGSVIATSSSGAGDAGGVQISANNAVALTGASTITASSTNTDAGNVLIFSGGTTTLAGSAVTAEAAGSGGNVSISSDSQIRLRDSTVTTSAGATGGNISLLAPQIIRLNNSLVATISILANGGNIRIDPLELSLTNGSAINASGAVDGGNITILADSKPGVVLTGPLSGRNVTATGATGVSGSVNGGAFDPDLVGSLVSLSSPLATGVGLTPQCGLRFSQTAVSSFSVTGRGGEPPEPGAWIPDLDLHYSWERRKGSN